MSHLQGRLVGNSQTKAVEDGSLFWIWAKTQVSFLQPMLLDGGKIFFCLWRGLSVSLELVPSVQAACSMDALSINPPNTCKGMLNADLTLSEELRRETYCRLGQGKHKCTKLESSLISPPSPRFLPFAIPLSCWLDVAPTLALPGLVHLARWLLSHWWAGWQGA